MQETSGLILSGKRKTGFKKKPHKFPRRMPHLWASQLVLWLKKKKSSCQCKRCSRCGLGRSQGRKWQSISVFLPEKSHGLIEEPRGLPSIWLQRAEHDWAQYSMLLVYNGPIAIINNLVFKKPRGCGVGQALMSSSWSFLSLEILRKLKKKKD